MAGFRAERLSDDPVLTRKVEAGERLPWLAVAAILAAAIAVTSSQPPVVVGIGSNGSEVQIPEMLELRLVEPLTHRGTPRHRRAHRENHAQPAEQARGDNRAQAAAPSRSHRIDCGPRWSAIPGLNPKLA